MGDADTMTAADRRVTFDNFGGEGPMSPSSTNSSGLKKKSSLKLTSSASLVKKREAGTSVSFMETVTVRQLPAEEAEDAQDTRKGPWEAAPEHDELWDGDRRDFWEQEKTLEEVHRIVVVRQMRMALEYNLGYAFYAMVANFKKRRPAAEPDPARPHRSNSEDVVPQFETPGAEETAIRKEIRELFADSVKGLDFPDLIKDREAFEKIYQSTVLNLSEMKRVPGLGLLRIEELVDEIINSKEMCDILGVQYIPGSMTDKGQKCAELEKIESEVGKEEKRRNNRRASIEAMNNGVSVFAERRASIEAKRRTSIEASHNPIVLGDDNDLPIFAPSGRSAQQPRPISNAAPVAEPPSSTAGARRPSLTTSGETRRPSLTTTSPGETRRPSLTAAPAGSDSRRSSVIETPAADVRRSSITTPPANNGGEARRSSITGSAGSVPIKPSENLGGSKVGHFLMLILGLVLLALSGLVRSIFGSKKEGEAMSVTKGSGALGWFLPLLIVFAAAIVWK